MIEAVNDKFNKTFECDNCVILKNRKVIKNFFIFNLFKYLLKDFKKKFVFIKKGNWYITTT